MGLASEFKDFINKGNVVDLAVGVVIGGAFGKIVNSLVNDIIMPPIGMLISGVNFTDIKIKIKEASMDAAGKQIPAMAKSNKAVDAFMAEVKKRNGSEPEFLQAVHEVAEMVIPFIEANPKYKGKMLLERMV